MKPIIAALALVVATGVACKRSEEVPPAPLPAPPAPAPKLAPAPLPPVFGVAPVEGDVTLRDFAFASGEKLAELRIHYTTIGMLKRDAAGHATNAVLVLHGTGGSGQQFLRPQFADELYGPGQPLDVATMYVILIDDIGHGGSSKPSDGMHARFPHYRYRDMVTAEHAVLDALKVDHLRLLMGTSMGCMHSWMWLETWPDAIDAAMPLACLPIAIAGRNREWRKLAIEAIRSDPAWRDGEYTSPPVMALRVANAVMTIAGSSPIRDQKRMPTREIVDETVERGVAQFLASVDANDLLYALESSTDYDPSKDLEKITAPVMYVNSADDFINPPELAIAEREIKRVKRGKFVLIPASEDTHGHGTHTWGALWKPYLLELLAQKK